MTLGRETETIRKGMRKKIKKDRERELRRDIDELKVSQKESN